MPNRVKYLKSKTVQRTITASILIFGFSSTVLITTNGISYNQFKALSFVLENHNGQNTILAGPAYSWILYDIFSLDNVPTDYSSVLFYPIETEKFTVIADSHFILDQNRGEEIRKVYNNTESIKYFEGKINNYDAEMYPHTGMITYQEGFLIDVRTGEWEK